MLIQYRIRYRLAVNAQKLHVSARYPSQWIAAQPEKSTPCRNLTHQQTQRAKLLFQGPSILIQDILGNGARKILRFDITDIQIIDRCAETRAPVEWKITRPPAFGQPMFLFGSRLADSRPYPDPDPPIEANRCTLRRLDGDYSHLTFTQDLPLDGDGRQRQDVAVIA